MLDACLVRTDRPWSKAHLSDKCDRHCFSPEREIQGVPAAIRHESEAHAVARKADADMIAFWAELDEMLAKMVHRQPARGSPRSRSAFARGAVVRLEHTADHAKP